MKRFTLMLALLALMAAPVLAQSTLNTNAPGPSQETKPGQTNNNLQNPGANMQQPAQNQNGTYQEHGTVQGTTNESVTGTNDLNNQTGTSTGVNGTTPTTTTTPAPAPETTGTTTGTMSNDTSMSTGSSTTGTTTTTTTDTTGSYSGNAADTATSSTPESLPKTASDLPTVALAGLLALAAFFAVRVYAKRNA